ncbi:tudor domain-containing protein 7-like [Trichogramma pretiosum]|uniref:tudor domain-containing protein 7-like n=1 Tax=Trichogramma pretiosum TaxID=7493 RepID=UPI0006C99287|nr:tudor domain-containing protein 7-like [Trichogramma pretiosum]XP_014225706.1 tudor domain-containing protein 7-like [Trichogramma pretiosum]
MVVTNKDEFANWASIIRSCALTSKTPLTFAEINRDVKMLEGKDIPFQSLGFRTLEDMCREIKNAQVVTHMGKRALRVMATAETAHIMDMVSKQKSKKKKPLRTIPQRFNRPPLMSRRPPGVGQRSNAPYNSYTNRNNYGFNKNYNNSYQSRSQSVSISRNEPYKHPPKFQPFSSLGNQISQNSHQPALKSSTTTSTSTQGKSVHFSPPLSAKSTKSEPDKSSVPASTVAALPSKISSIQQRLNAVKVSAPTPPPPLMQVSVPEPTTQSSVQQRLQVVKEKSSYSLYLDDKIDPRLRLAKYCESKNLKAPVYNDRSTSTGFLASVAVGSSKHSSYPLETKSAEEAQKLAAQAALNAVLKKNDDALAVTSDRSLIISRIADMVDNHPSGVFEHCLSEEYCQKYYETLPTNWVKLVEQAVAVDVGANNMIILSPQNRNNTGVNRQPISRSIHPGLLELPSSDEFYVHIYAVYDTTYISGVIIDEEYSDQIVTLAEDMKLYYDQDKTGPVTVIPNEYYAVYEAEAEAWHRVRCLESNPDKNSATIFFIDRGDKDEFPYSRFRTLPSKFCDLPGQAVRIVLKGFENLADCKVTTNVLEDLLVEKDVIVCGAYPCTKFTDKYSQTISAQLYLGEDEKSDLTILLHNKIADPSLLMSLEKTVSQVHIVHVEDKTVFINFIYSGFTILEELMNNITKEMSNNPALIVRPTKLKTDEIYIAQSPIDKKWYRVKVTQQFNSEEFEICCIDVGNKCRARRNNLVLLDNISSGFILKNFPSQAVQCRLHKVSPIDFNDAMVERLKELAKPTDKFYMKVIDDRTELTVVEFYIRTESNYLASLNDTLALEPQISPRDNNNNPNNRPNKDKMPKSILKSPEIPKIGGYIDVHVSMAAHPGSFTIQPLDSAVQLQRMMDELFRVCRSYTGPAVTPFNLELGTMYAAKCEDNRWYRAYACKIISKTMCGVYFCDYGDYRAIDIERLQPLQDQFYELPSQAIKAKIHGIMPHLKGDWLVKDAIRFNELVVSKNLVVLVKSYEENPIPGQSYIGVELIDTSTADDIYISQILIQEGRAEKVE